MKRSKFNKIIDDASQLLADYMDKINEILQDEKFMKSNSFEINLLGDSYADAAEQIVHLKNIKRDLNGESMTIENLFALNNADMFDKEEEE